MVMLALHSSPAASQHLMMSRLCVAWLRVASAASEAADEEFSGGFHSWGCRLRCWDCALATSAGSLRRTASRIDENRQPCLAVCSGEGRQ